MKKIAVLTTTALLAVGGSSAAYAAVASTPDAAPAPTSRNVLGTDASPSFVRTSAGVTAVEPRHHARHAEPRNDHGRHAEPGDDHGRHHGEHHGGHGSDD